MEIWKPINENPDYRISNFGNVMGMRGNLLSPRLSKNGYLRVHFKVDGKLTDFYIHRLVALHFIPNVENKPEVNHKDGDKSNNNSSNLEWTTGAENTRHAYDFGLGKNISGERHYRTQVSDSQVNEMRSMFDTGSTTIREISSLFGISYQSTYKIVKRLTRN